MRSLRKHHDRMDRLQSEVRPRRRGRVGRYVYLTLLGALALMLFDMLAGDLAYLRGDGMVTQDVAVIAPEYTGSVKTMLVAPGDTVAGAQVLGTVRSQKMITDIAQLSAQVANADARLSQLRVERQKLASLLPAANRRVKSAENYRQRLARLERSGLATGKQIAAAVAASYSALESLRELEARAELVGAEHENVRVSADKARQALDDLEALYGDGILTAPVAGLVGTVTGSPGMGVKQGDPLIEIFHGRRYVLAYIPVGALYDVAPGDRVVMRFGFQTVPGRVDALLPLAHRLPQEFQRQFRAVERKQLLRIQVLGDAALPLFSEVEVTWRYSPRVIFAKIAKLAVDAFGSGPRALAAMSDTARGPTHGPAAPLNR